MYRDIISRSLEDDLWLAAAGAVFQDLPKTSFSVACEEEVGAPSEEFSLKTSVS